MRSLRAFHTDGVIEAGCDEAGRGCLAGPVVAAAVILPSDWDPGLDDSKKLSEKKRAQLAPDIKEHAIAWAIAAVQPTEIDQINILNASFLAMHRAVEQLKTIPQQLLIDGNRFNPYPAIPHHCIVKGDGIYRSIAAASVLAKTHRDELMRELHEQFPYYTWDQNKGYPTKAHRAAISNHGISPHHRSSFQLLPKQFSLDL